MEPRPLALAQSLSHSGLEITEIFLVRWEGRKWVSFEKLKGSVFVFYCYYLCLNPFLLSLVTLKNVNTWCACLSAQPWFLLFSPC